MLGRNTANKLKTTSPSPIHVSCPYNNSISLFGCQYLPKIFKASKNNRKTSNPLSKLCECWGVCVCFDVYFFVYYLSSKSVFVKLLADIHIKFSILYLHCGVWVFYASTTQNMAYPEAIFILYAPNDLQTISPF